MMYTTYDALYAQMKNRFTVVSGKSEYTLGEFMRNKADRFEKKKQAAVMPKEGLTSVVSVAKKAKPAKVTAPEKTLTAFPLRTAVSALIAVMSLCLAVLPVMKLKSTISLFNTDNAHVVTVTPTVLDEEDLFSTVNL